MTKQTIYIAGPMTGLPDLNFPAFAAEAARLRALGHEVINPAEINPDKHLSWRECMMTDIAALVFCDAIQLLPGWHKSAGANLEFHVAQRLGLTISFAPGEPQVIYKPSGFVDKEHVAFACFDPEDDLK